ncbi:unnamed protein product [Orchesella dallaii]|uniref:Uncharacterized protein n=1 Tax=Orchesella dallaii TaxID=48710 RepID=A0ABP1Q8H7_9HEXA
MAQSGTPTAAYSSDKKSSVGKLTSAGKSHDGHDDKEVLVSRLPIPCMNGQPVDIHTLTVDQLQKFFKDVYISFYHTTLPSSSTSSTTEKPPSWWSFAVTFDSSLQLHPGFYERWHQKYMVDLLWRFYDFCGYSRLLNGDIVFSKANKLQNGSDVDPLKSLHSPERNLVVVGRRIVPIYDLMPLTTEAKQQEALELEQPLEASLKVDSPDPGEEAGPRKQGEKLEEVKNQAKTINIEIPKIYFPKADTETKKYSNPQPQNACKDVLNNREEVHKNHEKSSPNDHEKEEFMNWLGLIRVSHEKPVTNTSAPLPCQSKPPAPVCRTLRKLPSRNPLLVLFQNNPFLPITSGPGQRLLSLYGEKVEYTYPPPYESYCGTDIATQKKAEEKIPETKYPILTDQKIVKNGVHPHIYSYGRGKLQRTKRYQELVVGLSRRSWPALNKCKEVRVQMKQRVTPSASTSISKKQIEVRRDKGITSCIVKSINATFVYPPPVHLTDFVKQPSAEFISYVQELVKRKATDHSCEL